MDTSAAQDGVLDENSVDLQQLENGNGKFVCTLQS